MTSAMFVWVIVTDTFTGELARCRFRLTAMAQYGLNPFNRNEALVNSVRTAVDRGIITFYPSAEGHPDPVQGNIVDLADADPRLSGDAIKQFIAEKVWHLGFKSGGRPALTWLADRWDADYLNCTTAELLQNAAVLNAQSKIILYEGDDEFAVVGTALLKDDGPKRNFRSLRSLKEFKTAFHEYVLGEKIGEGGSGRVYKATDDEGRVLALKHLKKEAISAQKSGRFKNEMYFCMKSSHKNIVRVLDYGLATVSDAEVPFYVMPLYTQTLRDLMMQKAETKALLRVFLNIIAGISSAHAQGIYHRDLKPENILYDPVEKEAVVSDFGVAHFTEELLHATVKTLPGERLANFRYAAPEQVIGGLVDHRADIYALGLILYEMLSGELLRGTGHRTIASIASGWDCYDPIINAMTRQSPAERCQSIDDVKALIEPCIAFMRP
jgi:hypothetical protein